jgi:hypothetical protein
VYKQLKQYPEGAAMFRKAIELCPGDPNAYKQWAAVSAVSFLQQQRAEN